MLETAVRPFDPTGAVRGGGDAIAVRLVDGDLEGEAGGVPPLAPPVAVVDVFAAILVGGDAASSLVVPELDRGGGLPEGVRVGTGAVGADGGPGAIGV